MTQPLVTEFLAERSGHDYSIEDTISFNVPAPGLIAGMGLQLSNGRELSYNDGFGTVMFFDPSTKEDGPGAALVDRDAFLDFLQREQLEAVGSFLLKRTRMVAENTIEGSAVCVSSRTSIG